MIHRSRAALLCGTMLALACEASAYTFDTSLGSVVIQNQSSGQPVTWAQPSVPITFQLGAYNDEAVSALLEWSAVVPLLVPSTDAPNVVRWSAAAEDLGMLAARTDKEYGRVNGCLVIVRATVVLNARLVWSAYDGPLGVRLDVRRVVLHELGHVLGLEHPDEGGQQVAAIMNHATSDLDELQADDIAGIERLYPPSREMVQASAMGGPAAAAPSGGHGGGCAMRDDGDPDIAFWLFVAALVVHWLAARVLTWHGTRKTLKRRMK